MPVAVVSSQNSRSRPIHVEHPCHSASRNVGGDNLRPRLAPADAGNCRYPDHTGARCQGILTVTATVPGSRFACAIRHPGGMGLPTPCTNRVQARLSSIIPAPARVLFGVCPGGTVGPGSGSQAEGANPQSADLAGLCPGHVSATFWSLDIISGFPNKTARIGERDRPGRGGARPAPHFSAVSFP